MIDLREYTELSCISDRIVYCIETLENIADDDTNPLTDKERDALSEIIRELRRESNIIFNRSARMYERLNTSIMVGEWASKVVKKEGGKE